MGTHGAGKEKIHATKKAEDISSIEHFMQEESPNLHVVLLFNVIPVSRVTKALEEVEQVWPYPVTQML